MGHVIAHWNRWGNLIGWLAGEDASNYRSGDYQPGLVDLLGLPFKRFTHFLYMNRRNSINFNSKLTCITIFWITLISPILHSSASSPEWSLQILHLQLRLQGFMLSIWPQWSFISDCVLSSQNDTEHSSPASGRWRDDYSKECSHKSQGASKVQPITLVVEPEFCDPTKSLSGSQEWIPWQQN